MVDGGSLNGKSTIANRIAKHVNGIVLDIDLLCKDWLEEQLKSAKTPIYNTCFFMYYNRNFFILGKNGRVGGIANFFNINKIY